MAVKKPAGFATGGLFCCAVTCLCFYLRFLAGVPPRGLGSLLPPRAAVTVLALLLLLEADALLLLRLLWLTSWLLASARALRAARLGR